jgi:hemolysin III
MVKSYSTNEEIANAVSHGLGALLAVMALTLLISNAISQNDLTKVISFSIYGASLIILFLASTLYHSLSDVKAKSVFKLLDNCAI